MAMPTLAGTRVSVGSRSSSVDYYPSSSTGGGPAYKVGFTTTPTGIGVGDIGLVSAKAAGDSGGTASDYKYRVDAIDGSIITLLIFLTAKRLEMPLLLVCLVVAEAVALASRRL